MTNISPLILERQDAVAIISLNDPPCNRMSLQFMDQLEETLETLAINGTGH
jgi:enoyl-CoA hydratase/carnithine racemase